MREYLVTVLLAAIITYLVTPLVKDLAVKAGAVSAIRSRDVHLEPTPRWGGLAMWLSMALTLVIVNYLPLVHKSFGPEATGIFLSGTLILLIGMVDDRFDLDPITKFAGQALAAGILLIYGVQILWLPINGITTLPTNIGQLLTVLFVMVVINAINFVDGLDGLAAGVVGLGAAAFFAYSYLLSVEFGFSRATLPTLISALLVGMTLGFLPHNMFPARVFMGDTGSMLIGLMLAACAITLTGQTDPGALELTSVLPSFLLILLPLAVIAVPLFDLALAVMRRTRRGANIFTPDKEHLHHRLLERGHSHRRAVMLMHAGTALLAFATVSTAFIPFLYSLSALIAGLASLVYFGRRRDPKKVVVA